ncbi:MAG TPA: hypothetical protein VGG55_03560 [Candidatus Acidoferrales bacterium]
MKIIGPFLGTVAALTLAILALHNIAPTASAEATRVVTITDPILNMQAYSLSIPANWIFDGAVIPGTSCNDGPFPVFRMMSPDGLTGVKQLPRLDWTWADNNGKPLKSGEECLPYKREVPAAEVLKYMVGVLEVEYVREEPAADREQTRRNAAAQSSNMLALSADKARAVVRYHVNKIAIEEKLNVFVACRYFRNIGQHSCSANVSRVWTPEKSFSDATFQPIVKSFTVDKQWTDTRTRIMVQKISDMSEASMRAIRQMGDEAMRRSKAQFNAFNQAQEMRQRQHEQFLASMQRGTDMSMARAAESANARHQAADDWCDYSLDLQKRLDPRTGEITKDSSAYSYTWVNEQGKRVQTNDVNANPNGNGTGNWTLQENVR